jgi:toxin ParE1/3/4
MKPAIFHPEAEAEFRGAIAYYEGQREGLGGEYRAEIEAAVGRIRRNPITFPLHDKRGTRKCRVHRFPYTVYYLEFDEFLWVASVAHHRRRPNYWAGRTPEDG